MTEEDVKLYRATLKAWARLKEQGGGVRIRMERLLCPCGSSFETRASNRVYCDGCRDARAEARRKAYRQTEAGKAVRKKINASSWAKIKARDAAQPEVREKRLARRSEHNRTYYQRNREAVLERVKNHVHGEVAVPLLALEGGLIQRPCDNGCGAMVTRASRKGRTFCQKCREEHRRASKERYRHSEKGKAQQAAANQRFSMDEEAKARKAERAKERREERQQALQGPPRRPGRKPQPKVELEPKPLAAKPLKPVKEKPTPVPKPPKAKPVKVQEPVARRLPTEEEKLLMLRAALKRYHGN